MRKMLSAVFISICILVGIIHGQDVMEEWVILFDGLTPVDILVDEDGYVYVTGNGAIAGHTHTDIFTQKYDPNGDLVWSESWSGPEDQEDYPVGLGLDRYGSVYVAGVAQNMFPTSEKDYITIKYTAAGQEAWVRAYDEVYSWDRPRAVVADPEGGVYVTGESWVDTSGFDVLTINYGAAGDTAWISRFDGGNHAADDPAAAILDSEGNVVITGIVYGETSNDDISTLKLGGALGTLAWASSWGSDDFIDDYGWAVAVDGDDNVYVAGETGSGLVGETSDYVVIRYLQNGIEDWVRTYNGPGDSTDVAVAVVADSAGNAYVTGTSWHDDTRFDYYTIKYDIEGNVLWEERFDGDSHLNDEAVDIAMDDEDNIYVLGSAFFPGTMMDLCTVKYDSLGNEQWSISYAETGSSAEYAKAITLDSDGNIYVAGHNLTRGMAIIKYTQSTPVKPHDPENMPLSFNIEGPHPNPFNPSTLISFDLPVACQVALDVFDIQGRRIGSGFTTTHWYNPGHHSLPFDGSGLPSGIYLYRITAEDFTGIGKMVLMK